MSNKKLIFSLFFLFGIIFVLNFVAAGCCSETVNGQFCQEVEQSQCKSTAYFTNTGCSQASVSLVNNVIYPYCQLGTCIDDDQGTCSSNTARIVCDNEGGKWDVNNNPNEISKCKQGCCAYGDSTFFGTQTECNQIGIDYGIKTDWDPAIKDEFTCLESGNAKAEGACVLETNTRTCVMTSKGDCISQGGDFAEGYLCTAPHLSTDCAKTENTLCDKDGKVYFLDSCKNKANIYDEMMFEKDATKWTPLMEEYWERIQEPLCTIYNLEDGIICGDCNYIDLPGTTCRDYKEASSTPPKYGNYVCADLGCDYDNGNGIQRYEHGESFCANSEGVYFENGHGLLAEDLDSPLRLAPEVIEDLTSLEALYKYNLPGSRYSVLRCIDGEIIPEPCADFRNEICIEGKLPDSTFKVAQCFENRWQRCTSLDSKSSCEDIEDVNDCRWLEGYRWDNKLKNTNSEYSDSQGSCVPLHAPGLNLWDEKSAEANSAYCKMASVVENVIYETWWGNKRDNFKDIPAEDSAERCIENCYAIPGYGKGENAGDSYGSRGTGPIYDIEDNERIIKQNEKTLKDLWIAGDDFSRNILNNYVLSLRKGYYCHKKKDENKTKVGAAKSLVCMGNDAKRMDVPVFMTHDKWISFLWERTKALGDCGYKPNVYGEYSAAESETVTVIFQKLEQDFEVKDGEPQFDPEKINQEELGGQKIYVGDTYTGNNESYRTDRKKGFLGYPKK
ncbi:MAG: hypothetical protein U9Q99_02205 [Nanoarchaeota archaeon]|nr:hypothetical protein [Nanoarchaeota archaeon]